MSGAFSIVADCLLSQEARAILDAALGGDFPSAVPAMPAVAAVLARLHAIHPEATITAEWEQCPMPKAIFTSKADPYKLIISADGVIRVAAFGGFVQPDPARMAELRL